MRASRKYLQVAENQKALIGNKVPETRGGINFYNIFQNNVKQFIDQRH